MFDKHWIIDDGQEWRIALIAQTSILDGLLSTKRWWQQCNNHSQHQLHGECYIFIYVIQTFVGRVVLTNIWFLLNLREYILQCIVYLITHCVTSGTDMFWHHSCRPSLCVLRFSAIAADLKVVPPQLFAYLTLFALNVHISYRACYLSCPACLLHSRSFLCSPAPPFQCSAWLHQCHFCRPRLLSSAPCWWSLLLLRLS